MWQAEIEATSISSGSTALSTAQRLPTTLADAEPASWGTPSKDRLWPRL